MKCLPIYANIPKLFYRYFEPESNHFDVFKMPTPLQNMQVKNCKICRCFKIKNTPSLGGNEFYFGDHAQTPANSKIGNCFGDHREGVKEQKFYANNDF